MSSMTEHMARDLVKNQVLTEGFKTFDDLELQFDEEQRKLLETYLDMLLSENIFKINDKEISVEDEEINEYVITLLSVGLDLTITSFINWGIALFYKNWVVDLLEKEK